KIDNPTSVQSLAKVLPPLFAQEAEEEEPELMPIEARIRMRNLGK
ncbi:unnamed protein product, partial [Didymodactylos carnosus]